MACSSILLFAGNVPGAKRAVLVGVVFLTTGICLTLPLTLSLGSIAPRIFTSDPCLLGAVSSGPMFVLAVVVLLDWIRVPFEGVVKGSGKQLLGAIINLICYWAVALPLGVVLAIVAGLGAIGYWIGLTSGLFLQCVLYTVMLLTMNWKKESDKAWRMAGTEADQPFQESDHELQAQTPAETNPGTYSTMYDAGNSDLVPEETASALFNKSCSSDQDTEPLLSPAEHQLPTKNDPTNALSTKVDITHCQDHETSNLAAVSGVETDDTDALLLLSETEGSSEEENVDYEASMSASDEVEQSPNSIVRIPLRTIVLRVFTLVVMFVLLAVSLVVSQLYVYQSGLGPCLPANSTLLSATANTTTNATNQCISGMQSVA